MSCNTARDYRQALLDAGLWDGAVDELPGLDELRAAVERAFPAKQRLAHQQSSIDGYRSLIAPLAKQGVGALAACLRVDID